MIQIQGKFGVVELQSQNFSENIKARMQDFATSQDIAKLALKVNGCAKTQEIEAMENRVTPLIENAH